MNYFTPKQRLLNAMKGLENDRTPWSPFLAYYWESLPKSVQKKGQLSYLQEMGADPLLRGFHQLFETRYKNCTITQLKQNGKKCITYDTPVGSLQETYTYASDADSWFLTSHAVNSEEDFKVLQYLYENLEINENFQDFQEDSRRVGSQALFLPLVGIRSKTAFQTLVEHWCGTENLTYALYDFEEAVRECLDVMDEKDMETVKISAKSDAEALLFFEDSSTTNISPAFFQDYTLPAIENWGKCLHENGKLLIHHACGHIRDLLPLMDASPIDLIESISPPPTGNVDIPEAFSLLSADKGLIGGIEPTFFLNCTLEELEMRVGFLLEQANERRFILANSDSCPPNVDYEKFTFVSQLVRHKGELLLQKT